MSEQQTQQPLRASISTARAQPGEGEPKTKEEEKRRRTKRGKLTPRRRAGAPYRHRERHTARDKTVTERDTEWERERGIQRERERRRGGGRGRSFRLWLKQQRADQCLYNPQNLDSFALLTRAYLCSFWLSRSLCVCVRAQEFLRIFKWQLHQKGQEDRDSISSSAVAFAFLGLFFVFSEW